MNWMGRKPHKRKRPEPEGEQPVEPDGLPAVPFMPVRCPKCGATSGIKNNTPGPGPVRYHKCQACEATFRSVEVVPD